MRARLSNMATKQMIVAPSLLFGTVCDAQGRAASLESLLIRLESYADELAIDTKARMLSRTVLVGTSNFTSAPPIQERCARDSHASLSISSDQDTAHPDRPE